MLTSAFPVELLFNIFNFLDDSEINLRLVNIYTRIHIDKYKYIDKLLYGKYGKSICKILTKIIYDYFYNMEIMITWTNPLRTDSIIVKIGNKKSYTLAIGDCIRFFSIDSGVQITNFTGENSEHGPIGFEYKIWNPLTNSFEIPIMTLRGNLNHIITYPYGCMHYGQHIIWPSVRKINLF